MAPRILIASESFSLERGGAARVGRLLAHHAAAERMNATLLALGDASPVADFGLPSRTAAGSQTRFGLACWAAARTSTHFVYNHPGIARAHFRGPILRRPFSVWLLGMDAWGDRMEGDYGRAAAAADQLVSISEYTKRRGADRLAIVANAEVCWLATEEDDLPSSPVNLAGPPTVLILSRIDRTEMQKGHLELIAAWPEIRAAVPDARLVIAGAGDGLDLVRQKAGTSSAAASITCTGWVSQADVAELWSRTHVYVMPSRQEGFGLVYIEAMRYGIPVVASIHDAGQEINVHGATGYNVDLDRRGDLAAHVVALLKDQDLIRRMGAAGQARWREHFCQSAFRRRLAPILAGFLRAKD